MTAPTEAPKKEGEYVVLFATHASGGAPTYRKLGSFKGSAASAIKQAAKSKAAKGTPPLQGDIEKDGEVFEAGEYVAIPARSFKPVKLATKTETRVTLS